MSGFIIALVTVLCTGFGGRDQRLIAQLSARMGRPGWLLAVAGLTTIATAALAAWAGAYIAAMLAAPAKWMLVAMALGVAAVELAWPIKASAPGEPTRSAGAVLLVFLLRQWSDAARFLLFALAAAFTAPQLVGAGGAAGGLIAITAGWAMGDDLERRLPLGLMRLLMAAVVGIVGAITALSVIGLI